MGKIITTHVTIGAPVEEVWKALTDLASYPQWNPFITAAAGTLAAGKRLKLTIKLPGGRAMVFRPWVTTVEPYRYIEWLGHLALPGIFDGRHSFKLTPIPDRRTLIQQSETFHGLMAPFASSMLTRTQAEFVAMNEALAQQTASTRTTGPLGPPEIPT